MLESDGPGGAEVFLLHSAEELRARGYQVVPVLPSWKTGWLAEQFRNRGFDPVSFTLECPIDWDCLKGLLVDLDRRGVDVIHSHEFTMAVYGAAAGRSLGKRHVITMHGNQWVMDARRRRWALKCAFGASDAVVAVSEDTRKHLLESMRLDSDAVVTIPNGIPAPQGDPERPRQEFALRSDETLLLAVGNLTERKGHIVLLRALRRLLEGGLTVPWRLIVAGEGPERPSLEAFIKDGGMESRVHLPGHRSDISDLQAAAEIMVMPSLWEGLPLAVLEGMHAGNAVIGSNASGIPEAIRDGVDGFLVTPGDDQMLADALRRLLEDPALRRRMGDSARKRALDRFSIHRMMDEYEELYVGAGRMSAPSPVVAS
jgi:glycosyltransferase involved in cell wall biosynthesis